jgi:hypothetical protein
MQRIYDTREKKKVELVLREPGKVGLYVCGVTVYDLCHVGHARTLVAFDVIVRHLRRRGLEVRLVRNITDVDDKIIRKANAERKSAAEVASFYADAMAADMAALGISPPDVEPRATAPCLGKASTTCRPARASRWASTSEALSISPCGRAPSRASRSGTARGGRGDPAGTSSARPWLTATLATRSTFTAAAPI